MRVKSFMLAGLVGVVGLGFFWGCTNLLPTQKVTLDLPGGLSSFSVQAGIAAEEVGSFNFDTPVGLGRGTMQIDPSVVTITPTGQVGGKIAAQLQAGGVLEITAWVGAPGEEETVFETGDEYGPFSIELDANLAPVSVSPNTASLTRKTLDLLEAGEFVLGLRIVSPVDGTVTIESLTLNLGL